MNKNECLYLLLKVPESSIWHEHFKVYQLEKNLLMDNWLFSTGRHYLNAITFTKPDRQNY